MYKKQICSIKHFDSLLKSFKRIAANQIKNNSHIDKYRDLLNSFLYDKFNYDFISYSEFEILLNKLLIEYKSDNFKSKSGFNTKLIYYLANVFTVSYTFENENYTRIHDKIYNNDTYITFRIYLKISAHRRSRIAIWRIKADWLN
jgi:hypothetical protein